MKIAGISLAVIALQGCVMVGSHQKCYGIKAPFVTVGPCLTMDR